MRRGVWISVAAALLALPLANIVLWHVAVGRLQSGLDDWTAQAKAAGLTVVKGRPISAGWPLAATLTVKNVAVTEDVPSLPGGLGWSADALTLRVSLSEPHVLDIEAAGQQRLRLGNTTLNMTADRMVLGTGLAPGDARAFDVLVENLRLWPANDSDPGRITTIAKARGHWTLDTAAGQGEPVIRFSLAGEDGELPAAVRWPLGPKIASLALDGAVSGPIPPRQPLTAWATAWRDGGGSLELQRTALVWGPLSLTAAATLALDEQLQPMGAGSSHLTGYAATLDSLANSGALSRSAVTAAKAVLSLLAGVPAEGENPDVDVPLTLQYRTLSMRQVPLLRLPEMDWPAP